ncbi:MAG: hypothetical protein QOI61_55 [Actinomycetota bacterium]
MREDIDALARAYDDGAVAASADSMREARAEDFALLVDEFAVEAPSATPWWRSAADQVIRYRVYSVTLVVVLAIILLRSPVPLPAAGGDSDATHAIPTADRTQVVETAPGPPLEITPTESFDFALPGLDSFEPVSETPSAEPPPVVAPPATLRFTQTGYASALAGTPVDEQPPANGLPVESLAGRVTKYSYARLSGGGTVLRLRALTDEGASMTADNARVQLCQITTPGWAPKRATPTSDAPAFSDACLEGRHGNDGVWAFTFSSVNNPLEPNGWAIVPITSGNATFRVTFAPTAV